MRSRMIAAALGIALVSWFPPFYDEGIEIVIALLFLGVFFRPQRIVLLLCFCSGVLYGIYQGGCLLERLLPLDLEGESLWIEGQVVGLPEARQQFGAKVQQFNFLLTQAICPKTKSCEVEGQKLRLTWTRDNDIEPGQYWRLKARLIRPRGLANPAGFDYQQWLIQQGIHGLGRVDHKAPSYLAGTGVNIDRLRWKLSAYLEQQLSTLSQLGLIKALVIGDQRTVSKEQWQWFAKTGTSHLVVISGLHIGIMAGLGYWIGRVLCVLTPSYYHRHVVCFSSFLLALLYSMAAGFTLPTQRALTMLCLALICFINARAFRFSTLFAIGLLICLLLDPLAAISRSFWFSYGAVAFIAWVSVGRYRSHSQPRAAHLPLVVSQRISAAWHVIALWLPAQWGVFFGLLPILLIALGYVSVFAILVNVVAVPLFSLLVVPGIALATLLLLVDVIIGFPISLFLWGVIDFILSGMLSVFSWIAPSMLLFERSGQSWLVALLAILGSIIVLLPKGVPGKYVGALLFLPIIFTEPETIKSGSLKITVLDVGQGLAIVISTSHHHMLYDLGASWPDGSRFQSVVAPYLKQQRIHQIDRLIVSHGDNDHAGGVAHFLNAYRPKSIRYGEPIADDYDGDNQPCQRGEQWLWDEVSFRFLNNTDGKVHGANNQSCVLQITIGKHQLLLPGDIERPVEEALVDHYGEGLQSDILIAPHHGSLSSSSWPFIRRIQAKTVIFSSGYLNRFKHPHHSVAQRYITLGASLYNTAKHGAITIRLSPDDKQVIEYYRKKRRYYWE